MLKIGIAVACILGVIIIATPQTAQADSAKRTGPTIAQDLASAGHAGTLVFSTDNLLFSVEGNTKGYRAATTTEPGASNQPLYSITFYPPNETAHGLDLSYIEEEGPQIKGTSTTLMLHTVIPLRQ
ncbi:MAG: hypothetical protein OXT65_01365 [Alphaproteobacteria bacterium]|nr:hypothetical protein [Alphaproteobacteria bacterium]